MVLRALYDASSSCSDERSTLSRVGRKIGLAKAILQRPNSFRTIGGKAGDEDGGIRAPETACDEQNKLSSHDDTSVISEDTVINMDEFSALIFNYLDGREVNVQSSHIFY